MQAQLDNEPPSQKTDSRIVGISGTQNTFTLTTILNFTCHVLSSAVAFPSMETKSRFKWALLKEIFWRPGVLTVSIFYFLLQLVSNLISWTLPPTSQARYQLVQTVTWRIWIAVIPLLTLLWIVLIVRAAIQTVAKYELQAKADVALLKTELESFKLQLGAASRVGRVKSLPDAELPELLALGEEWSNLHQTCLRGAGDGIDEQIANATSRTVDFLQQKLDDSHVAIFKNEPPEHREIAGRGTRDKHLIGLTAAKLKKINQIIDEQRRR